MHRQSITAAALCLSLLGLLSIPSARAEWIFREQAIMGTRCAVEFWSEQPATVEKLANAAFDEMRRIDRLMSTYKPDSELSRLNVRAAQQPQLLSVELFDLIRDSLAYSRLSDGAFDVTYASVGYLYDFPSHRRPNTAAIRRALPAIDYRHLRLDDRRHSVFFERAGIRLDLGGIAKGYAVDRAMAMLKRGGVTRAMVNAGGDTLIAGDRFGKPWIVGIRDPNERDKVVLRLPLTDTAISTSGDYERYFDEGGTRYHHIIDPKTGDSARLLRSATVLAPNALRSDALSTAVFVMGAERGLVMINRLDAVDAVVVTPQGKVLYSRGLAPADVKP
jgi:thiamine biosynthesis lipoprotein